MPVRFISFCPKSDLCNKKGQRLGSDISVEDARWRISNHLQQSTYHQLSADDADMEAVQAELFEEDTGGSEETDAVDKGEGKGDKGEKGDGRWEGRQGPYGKSGGWSKGGGNWGKNNRQIELRAASSSSASAAAAVPSDRLRLEVQAQRALKACRAAAHMSRQAVLAFEEEATNLKELVDELSKR